MTFKCFERYAVHSDAAARNHPFSRLFYMAFEAIPGGRGADSKEIHFCFEIFKKVAHERAAFARFLPYMKAHFYMQEELMYIKKTCGYIFHSPPVPLSEKGWLDFYSPTTHQSSTWKYWKATLDPKLCPACLVQHGKIYAKDEIPDIEPPLHDHCRCDILSMDAITPGGATKDGVNGADYQLAMHGSLPDYYITKEELYALGWKNGKSVSSKAPEKMVFGGIYENDNGHLPSAPGRIWYEADINYYEGRRNQHRILFSNDGLIFVTYDHYRTFYEVDLGG